MIGDGNVIGIKLPKNKKISLTKIENFLNPGEVYFSYQDEDTLFVKEHDIVEEGQTIIKRKKFDVPVIASVSGEVSFKPMKDIHGKKIKTIAIKNNGKEKVYEEIPYDYTYTKTEFLSLLKSSGIVGMGGAGFPTYLKYDTNKKIKTLIVNAVECEPFITADYVTALNHPKEIVKTLHWIMRAMSINECFIAIKVHNPLLKEKLLTVADKYKKIKVIEVPNLYPMGWEKSLVRYIKHTDYQKIPIEKGIVVNNLSTIYAIHQLLKYRKPLTERMVTFTGEGMKNPCNVQVKIGTKIEDILSLLGGIEKKSTLIVGGPMMGEKSSLKDVFLSPTMNCILARLEQVEEEMTCLKCGKCAENCPAKITPVLIAEYQDEPDILKHLHPENVLNAESVVLFVLPRLM